MRLRHREVVFRSQMQNSQFYERRRHNVPLRRIDEPIAVSLQREYVRLSAKRRCPAVDCHNTKLRYLGRESRWLVHVNHFCRLRQWILPVSLLV